MTDEQYYELLKHNRHAQNYKRNRLGAKKFAYKKDQKRYIKEAQNIAKVFGEKPIPWLILNSRAIREPIHLPPHAITLQPQTTQTRIAELRNKLKEIQGD